MWISSQADPVTLSKSAFCVRMYQPIISSICLFWFVHDPCLFSKACTYDDLSSWLGLLVGQLATWVFPKDICQGGAHQARKPGPLQRVFHGTCYRWFPPSKLNVSSWKGIILTVNFVFQPSILEGNMWVFSGDIPISHAHVIHHFRFSS